MKELLSPWVSRQYGRLRVKRDAMRLGLENEYNAITSSKHESIAYIPY